MPDPNPRPERWVAGNNGETDYQTADGCLIGWTGDAMAGRRGYLIDHDSEWLPRLRIKDCPDESAARAWVEAQVKGEGRDG